MESQGRVESRENLSRRLILFPAPLQGHINPMLQLASILYSKGFSITIIHMHVKSPNPSNFPHFKFLTVPNIEDQQPDPNDGDVGPIFVYNQYGSEIFRDFLAKMLVMKEEPVACLLTDALWHFSQDVARRLKLPNLVLSTVGMGCFSLIGAFPQLVEQGYLDLSEQDPRLEAPVPDIPILRGKDIRRCFDHNTEKLNELNASVGKQTKVASGIVWNSISELEEPVLDSVLQHFPCPSFTIGPFHKYFPASTSSLIEQDMSCLSWLDSQAPKSVLYVSFGSLVNLDAATFLEVAFALANSKQPFLWAVRPGIIHGTKWIEPLPIGFIDKLGGRGIIIKWAPQQEILAHPATGGFLTHCGWNSTLESICEGVPVICSPVAGDQPVNARFMSDIWKIGINLENGIKKSDIDAAIKSLMEDRQGQEMRERVLCFKEKVDLCLKEGGSSYQSLQSLVDLILSF